MTKLLIVIVIVLLSFSCTTRSGSRMVENNSKKPVPIWNVIDKKSAFVFEDKDNLIFSMKQVHLTNVLLVDTYIIYKDSIHGENLLSGWHISSFENIRDTSYYFQDSVYYEVRTKLIPLKNFKRKL